MDVNGSLQNQIKLLQEELKQQKRFEKITRVLFQVSNSVSTTTEPEELYKSIHTALGSVINAKNFFIALYHEETDSLTFPYCVDEMDGAYPDVSDVSKSPSLSAEVIKSGKSLIFTKDDMLSLRACSGQPQPHCSLSEIWLGVPLKTPKKTIGVMAVQDYSDQSSFRTQDLDIMTAVAEQVAIAVEYKRAEEALRESEKRYSAVVKQATDGIYILDTTVKEVIDSNEAFLKMTGWTREKIIGLSVYSLVDHDRKEIDEILAKAVDCTGKSGKGFIVGERLYKRRDGSTIAVETSATNISYGGRSLLCVIVRDLTERKTSEIAIRDSERRFRRLIENATDAIYLATSNAELIDVNQAACDALGYSREELLAMTIEDIDPKITNETFRELNALEKEGTRSQIESTHRRKDGSVFPVEIHKVTYREKGILYVLGIARDISLWKQNEEKLRASAERFKAFFSSINDTIFVHPLLSEGFAPFVEVNDIACERYGYTREEFLRLSALDITKREDASVHKSQDFRKQLLEKGQIVFETVHIRKNGEEFPVEINSNIINQQGKLMILAVVRDISERKQAVAKRQQLESQLQQAQKMESVGRLAGGVAHDFNNMLSVILGHTELALSEVDEDNIIHEDLLKISEAAEHSADLTRQLLAFARKQTASPQVIDLNETITSMLKMLRRLLGEDIKLTWKPDKDLWRVRTDPIQINQILVNLCVNARDAIKSFGNITITTSNVTMPGQDVPGAPGLPGEFICLSVADDGIGIPGEHLSKIFEPFFTTKEIGTGTGLGLSTVYGIVKQNQGVVHVESEPDKGTAFLIYLPRYHGKHEKLKPDESNPEKKPVQQVSILVVEDEPSILSMCKSMLSRYGHRVLTAGTPGEALKIVQDCKRKIDILLTDVMLPEMNGKDLADHIIQLYPDIKPLFMSGYPADTIANQGMIENGINFIEKPFSGPALVERIQKLSENR